jgi:hypothetical protein
MLLHHWTRQQQQQLLQRVQQAGQSLPGWQDLLCQMWGGCQCHWEGQWQQRWQQQQHLGHLQGSRTAGQQNKLNLHYLW